MHDAAILDVTAFTYFDTVDVGTQHGAVPDADLWVQVHAARQHGRGSNVNALVGDWHVFQVAFDAGPWKARAQFCEARLELCDVRGRARYGIDGVDDGASGHVAQDGSALVQ